MKFNQLYRILQHNGWKPKEGKQTGRHIKYVHPDFEYSIPVGRHPSEEVPTGTLHRILRDAGIE